MLYFVKKVGIMGRFQIEGQNRVSQVKNGVLL